MLKRALALAGLIAVAACSGSSTTVPSTTQVGGVTVNSSHGTMTATIDGSTFTATAITTATYAGNLLSIGGGDSSSPIRAIGLALKTASPGTFVMSDAITGANATLTLTQIPNLQLWTANVLGGSGSITLNTLSATGASGTFTFTAVPSQNATGNKVVTNGAFNVTFF